MCRASSCLPVSRGECLDEKIQSCRIVAVCEPGHGNTTFCGNLGARVTGKDRAQGLSGRPVTKQPQGTDSDVGVRAVEETDDRRNRKLTELEEPGFGVVADLAPAVL